MKKIKPRAIIDFVIITVFHGLFWWAFTLAFFDRQFSFLYYLIYAVGAASVFYVVQYFVVKRKKEL